MNRSLYATAFGAGLLAIGWVGFGYVQTQPLALTITALIGAFYLMGALELQRFHQATAALHRALQGLAEPPARLGDWLELLPASLRNAVRLRIEGDRVALPGPALAPYVAGLLVLLGMLGTFLGMVVTLSGTSVALERATDLQTMRDSLAAPVKGLGLAFGTSVAGVAASALLGLMSALCRRERQQAGQLLDTRLAGSLRGFGRTEQRELSVRLLQQQSELMPALVERLDAAMAQMQAQARQADEHLLASQQQFQSQAVAAYQALAASVDQSLRRSLSEGARLAGATLQSVVDATMSGITRETAALHGRIADAAGRQLDGLAERFERRSVALAETLTGRHAALSDQVAAALTAQLDSLSTRLEQAVQSVSTNWQQALAGHEHGSAALARQTLQAQADALGALAATLQREWQQATASTLAQQTQICATLEHTAARISAQAEAHARSTLGEMAGLAQTASEAPRAAAELVAQLRRQLSDSLARDNSLLDERSRVLAALNTLLESLQHNASDQRAAIDALVAGSAARLDQAGSRFIEKVDAESARMESTAAQLACSAVEVASLGEAFGAAVDGFSRSSDKLMAHLQRVDHGLGQVIARSDEQLAYYVAQAREVIDLSLSSQQQIVADLQRLAGRRAAHGEEAA